MKVVMILQPRSNNDLDFQLLDPCSCSCGVSSRLGARMTNSKWAHGRQRHSLTFCLYISSRPSQARSGRSCSWRDQHHILNDDQHGGGTASKAQSSCSRCRTIRNQSSTAREVQAGSVVLVYATTNVREDAQPTDYGCQANITSFRKSSRNSSTPPTKNAQHTPSS